jgi:hypothetical protein
VNDKLPYQERTNRWAFAGVSKFVFGPLHTFGWVCCSDTRADSLEGWKRPGRDNGVATAAGCS